MDKIALTARSPFTGCTHLARELNSKHGYKHISMSDILMHLYAEELHERGFYADVNIIKQQKEYYRNQLFQFGTFYEDRFITECVAHIINSNVDKIVIEKVRTNKQAHALHSLGFTLIRLDRPEHDIRSTARRHGHTDESWAALMRQGHENNVDENLVTETLTNSFSCDILCKYLVSVQ